MKQWVGGREGGAWGREMQDAVTASELTAAYHVRLKVG